MRKNRNRWRTLVGNKKQVLPAIVLAAMSATASGALNIYESFNYSLGSLQGNTNAGGGTANGNLWQRAGVANPPTGINVTSGGLSGPTELPPAVGNGLSITQVGVNDGSMNRLALDQNYTSGFVYYSFLLNVTDLTNVNNTTGAFFLSLNNSADVPQATNPTVVPGKVQLRADPGDGTKYNLGVFGQAAATSGSSAWSASQLDTGVTQFIVAAANPSTKVFNLWINPNPSSFGLGTAPAVTSTLTDSTTWSGNNIQSLLVRQTSTLANLGIDELRVGSTWADVTPTLSAYWDIDGATAGAGGATPSGNWTDSSWSTSAAGDAATGAFPSASYKAVFAAGTDATGSYTVTVSGTQSATALSFGEGTVTLTGGTVNVSTGVIEADTGVTARIESTIGSTSGLAKNGAGTVVLPGAMSYTGATSINAGTLQVGDGGTTGALPTSSALTNNGTLVFNRSDAVTQGTDFSGSGISGSGHLTQAGSGNLILNVPNTHTGITKATAGTITVTDGLALQNSTVDTGATNSIIFDNALTSASVGGLEGTNVYQANSAMSITVGNNVRNAAYSAAITGSGSLTKVGTIAQELTGVNTYSGGTNINAGVLQFGPTNSMPATGAVAVNSGGALSVHVSGGGEWSAATSGVGSLGGLISAGDGGQTASQVTWNDGSSLGINTDLGESVTYSGNIGSFNGVSDATKSVGLIKRGQGSLTLTGSNTFRGQLQVANDGGTVMLTTVLTNAGQSMPIPTVTIGNAGGTAANTDGSRDTGIKILTNDALPTNTVVSLGSSVSGTDAPSSLLQLYDGFTTSASLPSGSSYDQTIRGVTGGGGRIKAGLGTLTIDVPTGESYSSGGTLRTDYQNSTVHGKVIKTGPGRQDFNQANGNFNGDFILQQGTLGVGTANEFGATGNLTARLIINGGTLIKTSGSSLSINVPNVDIGGSFTFDPNGASDVQFLNSTINLNVANPTITVPASSTGRFIMLAKLTDNGAGYGFTKAGGGGMTLSPSGIAGSNNYSGATTILEGSLRVAEFSVIGNGSSDVNLSGGTLEFNGTGVANGRLFNVTNPVHVTADSAVAYNSTTTGLTDGTEPNGVVFEFSNSTFDRTGGTLTFQHLASSQGITFRPRMSASGFDYTGPVVVSNGAGTRKTVLESTNASGTQTWSGDITGTGSYSRGTGGNTLLKGQLVSVGGISVADSSSIQLAQSAGSDRVISTAALSIGTSSSQLDLTNNKLIVRGGTLGTPTAGLYNGVSGLVDTGRNGATPSTLWDGSGIVTSQSSASYANQITTLGVASAAQARGISGAQTALFGGQSVSSTDILVMYTYTGDANLSGNVDADDYFQIDSNYNKSGSVSGFYNGDFNYDGLINGDDYTLIDAAYAYGGPPISASAPSLAGVSAVPEPSGLLMGAVAVALAGGTRRRRRN